MTYEGRLAWHKMRLAQGKPSEYAEEFKEIAPEQKEEKKEKKKKNDN